MQAGEVVDLRSDTVTRPTAEMRETMARAVVGDDVYGEDPTVRSLEDHAASLVGHEAAIFVPSGTMGNQVAINLHTRPGSDVLLDEGCHVYRYELGAMAAWSGAVPRVIEGVNGVPTVEQVAASIAPEIYYMAPTALLVLENSQNHAGGSVLDPAAQQGLIQAAHRRDVKVHLDGARIFNAAAALGETAATMAAGVDSVMFCLSKGLGAPVGSMLCGDAELIAAARVVRKRMGGGLRQAGILAAAGLYALEHHVERLIDDHRRARRLAEILASIPCFDLDPSAVRTNIVIAALQPADATQRLLDALRERGVLAGAMGSGRIRFVTHLDIDDVGLERAGEVLQAVGSTVQ